MTGTYCRKSPALAGLSHLYNIHNPKYRNYVMRQYTAADVAAKYEAYRRAGHPLTPEQGGGRAGGGLCRAASEGGRGHTPAGRGKPDAGGMGAGKHPRPGTEHSRKAGACGAHAGACAAPLGQGVPRCGVARFPPKHPSPPSQPGPPRPLLHPRRD